MRLTDLQESKTFGFALGQAIKKLRANADKAESHEALQHNVEADVLSSVKKALDGGDKMEARKKWKEASRQTKAHIPAVAVKSFLGEGVVGSKGMTVAIRKSDRVFRLIDRKPPHDMIDMFFDTEEQAESYAKKKGMKIDNSSMD